MDMQLESMIAWQWDKTRFNEIYTVSGDRAYLVGAQDGSFPQLADLSKGRLGGLWAHPIKLARGFWHRINGGPWLMQADRYGTSPLGSVQDFTEAGLTIQRRCWVPEGYPGLIVALTIENVDQQERELILDFLVEADLAPAWLAERLEIADGQDQGEYLSQQKYLHFSDVKNDWHLYCGSNQPPVQGRMVGAEMLPEKATGYGAVGLLTHRMVLAPKMNQTIYYFLVGGAGGHQQALADYDKVRLDYFDLLKAKVRRYEQVYRQSQVILPQAEEKLNQVYDWVKFNLQMLWRQVPGVGQGFTAGIPSFPWWFGTDTTYTVLGALPMGFLDEAKASLVNLMQLSLRENGNGRVIHEASTNGVVSNPGNTQETPHFIKAVAETYRWTGDWDFLQQVYPFCKQAIHYLMTETLDGQTLLPLGFGIMEIAGLNLRMIDTAVYTYEALVAMGELAREMDDLLIAHQVEELASKLLEEIDTYFWNQELGLYHDLVGTPKELSPRMDQILWQMENDGNEQGRQAYGLMATNMREQHLQQTPDQLRGWSFHQWVMLAPLEARLASQIQAEGMLDRLEESFFTNSWGLKLSAYDPRVMTISTSVMAVAQCNYGRVDQGLSYLQKMANTAGYQMPGAISEMSPDYGCCLQAWTCYGFGWVLIVQMAGIRPQAASQKIYFTPQLPSEWDKLQVCQVKVGQNQKIDYLLEMDEIGLHLVVRSYKPNWSGEFALPIPQKDQPFRLLINGHESHAFTMSENRVHFQTPLIEEMNIELRSDKG